MPAGEQGVAHSRHRFTLVPRVLCLVFAGDDVLLLKGAPDKKIWPGKYNGLGGHVERDETVAAAARREIREEAGLAVTGLALRGVVTVDAGEDLGIGLFVFTAQAASRECRASSEGELEWVPRERVGDLDCVADVPWLIAQLSALPASAPPFTAHYRYDAAGEMVIERN